MNKYLKTAFVLYLLAAAVAGYMVWNHYAVVNGEAGFGSFCSLNQTFDCDIVNASAYSELLGIPLATWGLSWYLFALVLCFVALRNAFARREALIVLLPFSGLSMVATAGTMVIMFAFLKKLCIMCLGLDVLDTLTFVCVLLAWREYTGSKSLSEEYRAVVRRRLVVFAVTGLVVFGIAQFATVQMKHTFPFDADAFAAEFRATPVQKVTPGESARKGFEGEVPVRGYDRPMTVWQLA